MSSRQRCPRMELGPWGAPIAAGRGSSSSGSSGRSSIVDIGSCRCNSGWTSVEGGFPSHPNPRSERGTRSSRATSSRGLGVITQGHGFCVSSLRCVHSPSSSNELSAGQAPQQPRQRGIRTRAGPCTASTHDAPAIPEVGPVMDADGAGAPDQPHDTGEGLITQGNPGARVSPHLQAGWPLPDDVRRMSGFRAA
jgi:hypothetical protein